MPTIRVTSGPLKGQEFEIPAAGVLIGYRREKLEQAWARRRELGLPADGEPLLLEAKDAEHNISGLHCWVGPDHAGRVVVRDLGSMNGTYVGASNERIKEAVVQRGQVVRLGRGGALRFEVLTDEPEECRATIRGEEPKPEHVALAGKVIHLDRDVLNIGRSSDNDLVLDYPQISRHHCRIVRRSDGTFIEDLGSMNGTFVNGHRVREARLAVGDAINLGSFVLAFEKDRLCQSSYEGRTKFEAHDITKKVKDKTIIQGISFVSYPREFVGLIGPAGCGKTTLLNVITGYDNQATGKVVFSGLDLYENYDALRGNVGYVPQDDIVHRALTVEQSLYYTAKLRMPEDTSDSEIRRRVDRVIRDLGLNDCRGVLIGTETKKGISGGQRKRVNLAQELITEPTCLFLDEPTSGLSEDLEIEVMDLLKGIADKGKNVMICTHNIQTHNFDKLTNVVVIFRGRLVYYGPGREVFDYFGFGRDQPGKIFFHLNGKYCPQCDRIFSNAPEPVKRCEAGHECYHPPEYWEDRFRESPYYRKYVEGRMEVTSVKTGVGRRIKRQKANALRQWWILVQRYSRIKLADTAGTAVLLAQAPVIALLIGLVFGNKGYMQMGGVLFMMAIAAIWFGATNSCREIVSERSVYRRERMVNLKIGPYVLSKGFVLAVLLFIQCLILSVIVKAMVRELPGSVIGYTAVLTLGGIAGSAMGLLVSALLSSTEGAMGLVPVTLIPQVLFSGMVVSLAELGSVKFLADFMISRWVLDALSHFSNKTVGAVKPALAATAEGPKMVYWFPEMPTLGMGLDVLVLVVLTALFTVLTVAALKRKDIV